MLHRAALMWWKVGGITATSCHLPFIQLLSSYPGLVKVLENFSESIDFGKFPLKVYTFFFTGPWFLRMYLIPANEDLTSFTSSRPANSLALTLEFTDGLRCWRKDERSLSLQTLLQRRAGKGPACLQAPILTSCCILESSQDIKMMVCICIWNFWALNSWTRGFS